MKILFVILMFVIGGCSSVKESTSYVEKDSTIKTPPFHIDTVVQYYQLPRDTSLGVCDSFWIWKTYNDKYGSFFSSGTDTNGVYWKAKFDATKHRLDILTQEPEKKVPIFFQTNQTQIQTLPLMTKLGYVMIGVFVMLGFALVIKGFTL